MSNVGDLPKQHKPKEFRKLQQRIKRPCENKNQSKSKSTDVQLSQRRRIASINNSVQQDSIYISCLLDEVFTVKELQEGSFGGTRSNYNGQCHNPLDMKKLEFVESKYNL